MSISSPSHWNPHRQSCALEAPEYQKQLTFAFAQPEKTYFFTCELWNSAGWAFVLILIVLSPQPCTGIRSLCSFLSQSIACTIFFLFSFFVRDTLLRVHGNAGCVLHKCNQYSVRDQWCWSGTVINHCHLYPGVELYWAARNMLLAGSFILGILHDALHCSMFGITLL